MADRTKTAERPKTEERNGSGKSQRTTDHKVIKKWAEARGGRPATVRGTGDGGEAGILRFDFGDQDDRLEEISWEDFFEKFDDSNLEFLYQEEKKDGEESRFFKFVRGDGDGDRNGSREREKEQTGERKR